LQLLDFCIQVEKMANHALKQVFDNMLSKIVRSVNPDPLMDVLLSKSVISEDDYSTLRQVSVSSDRCRDLLSLLQLSPHPQTFLHLRLALLDEYSWIVDEVDDELTSPTCQLQQLHLRHSPNSKRPSLNTVFCVDFI